MEVAQATFETHADILIKDVDEQIVLLVKVQANKAEYKSVQQFIETWQTLKVLIPFAMFVDLRKTLIYKRQDIDWKGDLSALTTVDVEPVGSFDTIDILRFYEKDFADKTILKPYLTTLVDAWIGDLAYQWKLENPPASEQLKEIGLVQILKGITTHENVDIENILWRSLNLLNQEILGRIQQEVDVLYSYSYELAVGSKSEPVYKQLVLLSQAIKIQAILNQLSSRNYLSHYLGS